MKNDFSMSEGSAVAELNRVPGFDPMKYVRMTESGAVLDLPYKKLWFRLKHPNGITKTSVIRFTEQVAIMEARVFFDRNDSVPVATSTVQIDKSSGNEKSYLTLAQNSALDAALSDAGFGVQFAVASRNLQTEPTKATVKPETPQTVPKPPKAVNPTVTKAVPTAPQTVPAAPVQNAPQKTVEQPTVKTTVEPEASAKAVVSEQNTVNGEVNKVQTVEEPVAPTQVETAEKVNTVPATPTMQAVTEEKKDTVVPTVQAESVTPPVAPVTETVTAEETAQPEAPASQTYTADTPVEQIISQMSVEDAENYIVKEGTCAGWPMKTVMERRAASIKWYCTGYQGKDNILRAAATILLEKINAQKAS